MSQYKEILFGCLALAEPGIEYQLITRNPMANRIVD